MKKTYSDKKVLITQGKDKEGNHSINFYEVIINQRTNIGKDI